MRRAVASSAIATALSVASPARAEPSKTSVAAEELFRDGRALLEQGRFPEACAKLDASEKLDPAVGTLFSLGECYQAQSRLASAWFAYRAAAALSASREDQRRETAQQRADAIEPHVAHIAVRLADPRHPVEVSLDGEPLAPDALANPLPVDPGPHRIARGASTVPGDVGWSTLVQVTVNGALVEIEIPRAPTAESSVGPTSPARANSPLLGTLARGAIGAGAATLAVGTIFGMQAIVKGRDANAACPNLSCGNAAAVQENHVAKTDAVVSSVLIPVGAALASAGGVLFFASRGSVETTVGPRAAQVDARWSW